MPAAEAAPFMPRPASWSAPRASAVREVDQVPHELEQAGLRQPIERVAVRERVPDVGQARPRLAEDARDGVAAGATEDLQLLVRQAVALDHGARR
jgi:hypothetical protein